MKPRFKKLFKPLIIGFVALIGLGLTVSALVMLSQHSENVHELSKSQAQLNTQNVTKPIVDNINAINQKTVEVATRLKEVYNEETMSDLIGEVKLADLELARFRYFINEWIYDETMIDPHTERGSNDLAFAYRNAGQVAPAYLGSFTDDMSDISAEPVEHFEFYTSVTMCPFGVDGVSLYYNIETIEALASKDTFHTDASFGVLCSDSGVIYSYKETEKFTRDTNDFFSNLRIWVGDKSIVDQVQVLCNEGLDGAVFCKINGTDYVVSVSKASELSNLAVIELYNCDILNPSNRNLINSIVSVFALFVIIIVGTILYFIIDHARLNRKISNSETMDTRLNCLNRHGFEKESEQVFTRQKESYFGVIICEIRHFKYLNETFGEQEVNAILRHVKTVTSKIQQLEETYGYVGNGEFLILLHARDKEDLISRLKTHSFLTSQYKGSKGAHIQLKYGIYEHIQNEQTPVSKMVDYAREANNAIVKATVENVDMQFNFYNDDLRKIRLINEDMELRQEQALKDGEFQVFYQAKYNLKAKRQDGAEALVRWYDKASGVYNVPALFMPLFESNGFIEKLDKYVYSKVCEYISYSIANGRHVFPVSVNVSRITATQPDFIEYYSRVKKKFGIANGAITIEFTESFAYENYDVLRNIVDKLHANGFECSIDDFGCGYSSYRILKELPMDEIKLDKFFIDHTSQPERIEKIYDSIISLAKQLKMKVTQEGVETAEDVEILKKHECDVVQGYIYSKPISLTDYLHFCEESHNHKL